MIKEEYVSFEIAKLLKKAGFPQDLNLTAFYNAYGQDWHFADDHSWVNGYARPSQALAMRWLREKENISVEPGVTLDEQWSLNVWDFKAVNAIVTDDASRFPTYEAAAEAGIQAACKYLIRQNEELDNK